MTQSSDTGEDWPSCEILLHVNNAVFVIYALVEQVNLLHAVLMFYLVSVAELAKLSLFGLKPWWWVFSQPGPYFTRFCPIITYLIKIQI